jgi:hypothetical protein
MRDRALKEIKNDWNQDPQGKGSDDRMRDAAMVLEKSPTVAEQPDDHVNIRRICRQNANGRSKRRESFQTRLGRRQTN